MSAGAVGQGRRRIAQGVQKAKEWKVLAILLVERVGRERVEPTFVQGHER